MFCWRELGCKDRWTPDSVIRFGCEVNIGSIHEEEGSTKCVGSLIIGFKPKCDKIFSIALFPVVISLSYTIYLISH